MQIEDIQRIRDQQREEHEQNQREKQHNQLMKTITTGLKKLNQPTSSNNSKLIKLANQVLDLTTSK